MQDLLLRRNPDLHSRQSLTLLMQMVHAMLQVSHLFVAVLV
jgi:hypothetical protein